MSTTEEERRDRLWESIWQTFYRVYFEELLSDRMIRKWYRIDIFCQAFVAITTTSSAISGWVLWQQENWKLIWAILTGIGAILAITHPILRATAKIRSWERASRALQNLRFDLETLQHKIRGDFDFNIAECELFHEKYRNEAKKAFALVPNDFLITEMFKKKIQDELNAILSEQILSEKGG